MANYNRVILIGNLTRDPELRYTPGGTPVAKLGLATNRKYRGKDDQLKDEVTFVNVTSFGKQAENINKYLKKGAPVLIGGRLHYSQWQNAAGESRNKLEVISEDLQFLPRSSGGHSMGEPRADATPALTGVDDDSDPFDGFPNPLGLHGAAPKRRGDA